MARPSVLGLVLTAALVASAVIALALFGHTPSFDIEAARRTAGAKAFARVNGNGEFDAQRSRNVRGVTKQDTGTYCFDLAVSVKNVVASLNAGAGMISAGVEFVDGNSPCPDDTTDVFVLTFDNTSAAKDAPFYAVMH